MEANISNYIFSSVNLFVVIYCAIVIILLQKRMSNLAKSTKVDMEYILRQQNALIDVVLFKDKLKSKKSKKVKKS